MPHWTLSTDIYDDHFNRYVNEQSSSKLKMIDIQAYRKFQSFSPLFSKITKHSSLVSVSITLYFTHEHDVYQLYESGREKFALKVGEIGNKYATLNLESKDMNDLCDFIHFLAKQFPDEFTEEDIKLFQTKLNAYRYINPVPKDEISHHTLGL